MGLHNLHQSSQRDDPHSLETLAEVGMAYHYKIYLPTNDKLHNDVQYFVSTKELEVCEISFSRTLVCHWHLHDTLHREHWEQLKVKIQIFSVAELDIFEVG